MDANANKKHRWAVVLAGGDGRRLRELTLRIAGDSRPKQFCPLLGGKTLLAQTCERIAPLFDEEQILLVLSRAHDIFYREQLARVHDRRKVIQPQNRGTAVAMALCLEIICRQDADALIAFFPSDHHFLNASAFRKSIEYGLEAITQHPQSVLVLGAEAQYPEAEYGWIQPGGPVADSPFHPLRRVTCFWEKPTPEQARILQEHGCLWNTFVTVGSAGAFRELFLATTPQLMDSLTTCLARNRLQDLYDETQPVDFSQAVLSRAPERLVVLRDEKSGWMDLGSPRRVMEAMALRGVPAPRPAFNAPYTNENSPLSVVA